MLKLISEYTGLTTVSLIAGTPNTEDNEYVIGIINYGTSSGTVQLTFIDWDREGFDKNVVSQFTHFLNATRSMCSLSSV